MKKTLIAIPALSLCVITWMSCASESPTSSTDVEAPESGKTTTQTDSGVDPQNFSCANVEEVHVRFGNPGHIEENHVAVYAGFIGAPPGDKFLKIWWDYDNKREKYQIVDTQAGEVRRDNDLLYDVEAIVEHTYEGLTGPREYNVRVELVLEGGSRGCARNRKVTVTPPPAGPSCRGWKWNGGCWYTASAVNMSCNEVCASHGGFDAVASQHTGNQVGMHFWPAKADGSNWVDIECSSTDNNTNWGADGTTPNPDWRHSACYVNCACKR